MYCTVLYCTVLYCTVLHCTALYCTLLFRMVQSLHQPDYCDGSFLVFRCPRLWQVVKHHKPLLSSSEWSSQEMQL